MLETLGLIKKLSSPPVLHFQAFRYLWLSTVFSAVGFMGEIVVLGWVLLERTDSPFMVGVGMAVRMVPFFLFGILAGTISDRVNRRNLMLVLGFALAGVTGILSVIIINDLLAVWHLFIHSFIVGSLWALYQTSKQSFTYDIVGAKNLVNGFAFISLGMRVGAIGGSLSIGFLLDQIGAGGAYLLISISYLFSSLTLSLVKSQNSKSETTGKSVWRNISEFAQEARHNPNLLALVTLTAAAEIIGFSHQVLLPSLARDVLHVGSEGLGIMNAFKALGGIIAVLGLSALGDRPRKGLGFMIVLFLFGGGLMLLGNASAFPVALAAVMFISGMATLCDVFSQSMIQLTVSNELRGRAVGSWVLAVGTAPVGHLQIGGLASILGVSFALMTNGVVLAVLAGGCFVLLPRLRRL